MINALQSTAGMSSLEPRYAARIFALIAAMGIREPGSNASINRYRLQVTICRQILLVNSISLEKPPESDETLQ